MHCMHYIFVQVDDANYLKGMNELFCIVNNWMVHTVYDSVLIVIINALCEWDAVSLDIKYYGGNHQNVYINE